MNFWDVHGWGFLIAIMFCPRAVMLAATPIGGFLWWLGWLIAPAFQIAILATINYWETNPALVFIAWIWAIIEEVYEKFSWIQKSK